MPNKTDRILSYLPGTFQALPRPTALYSIVDAFGNELQQAENALVAVMRSHWVDTADQNEEFITDLAAIASLYGLSPRDDESVEDFRAHLKRYVRTFLQGTTTVQGALRLAAEALGLLIADDYTQMDTWWTRPGNVLTTVQPRGDDASPLLFGMASLSTRGSQSQPARIVGTVDLSGTVDLTAAPKLSLQVDNAAPLAIDFSTALANPASASLAGIITAINTAAGSQIAAATPDAHLALASPSPGAAGQIVVNDIAGDAAPTLLGLPPRLYQGTAATAARVTSIADLGGGVDLSNARYLRLLVDGARLAEIDCAGPDPAHTSLDQIVAAINSALGIALASHDGHFLSLTSTTTGFSSTIQFQSPAGQNAVDVLFGKPPGIATGRNAQPASLKGTRDISAGVDLSQAALLEIAIDGGAHLLINCAGAVPSKTTPDEVVAAINTASGKQTASLTGQFLVLTSSTTGPGSSIRFFTPAGDASGLLLGLPPRSAAGVPSSSASLAGIDIGSGVLDLGAQHLLQLRIDGGPALTVDFQAAISNYRAATLASVAVAINSVAAAPVAAQQANHLVLTSPASGPSSSISVLPFESSLQRPFVTRAFVLNEASQLVLGTFQQRASGSAAIPASVSGTVDLARGVDLRQDPFLQLSIDGSQSRLIDCSSKSPRPRIALPAEIVDAINTVMSPSGKPVATTDGHFLSITSPTAGGTSRIEFQPVTASDAASALGLAPAQAFGRDASGVTFVGTVDLSSGVDLATASKVKIAIDGGTPVEVDCAGPDPAHTTLAEIVTRINSALGSAVAMPLGNTIALASRVRGTNSKIEFLPPASGDATKIIFGVGPRAYHGSDALPPRILGSKDLSAGVDLSVAKFIQIGFDTKSPVPIDCSAGAADPKSVKPAEIVAAINAALGKTIAASAGGKLVLTGPTSSVSGKISVAASASDGAFARLMGAAAKTTIGTGAVPASIKGTVDLLSGVNLDDRRILRLRVNASRPLDVDISGVEPDKTSLSEIVAKLNAVIPDLASASDDDHLVLTSPLAGEDSSLEIVPIRALEIVEYSPSAAAQDITVKPGDTFFIINGGAAESDLSIQLSAPQGIAGAELVNRTAGTRVRVLDAVPAAGTLRIAPDSGSGIVAEITAADGSRRPVPASNILAGKLGAQAIVPFPGSWHLSGGSPAGWASLELSDPSAAYLTSLRAWLRGNQGNTITVAVTLAALPALPPIVADGSAGSFIGRLVSTPTGFQLTGDHGALLAVLRPGADVNFPSAVGHVVLVRGAAYPDDGPAPIVIADSLRMLYDVTVAGPAPDGSNVSENYAAVVIGADTPDSYALTYQVLARPSQLLTARDDRKSDPLRLPPGRSQWTFSAAISARFDQADFDSNSSDTPPALRARFAGGPCLEQGIFNVSRFSDSPPEREAAVFAPLTSPPVQLRLQWIANRPGTFALNLPADLDEKFGARFNQARFAQPGDAPELYSGAVMEPATDPDYIVTRIAASHLVEGAQVSLVPLGWEALTMPFRHPRVQPLTGGTDNDKAAIYLAETGVPGFVQLTAKKPGKWGNTIEVTARKASPGRFDITIGYAGARFENGRQTVFAGRILAPGQDPLPALTSDFLKPRPVGLVQGKAAGVLARVTRDQADAAL